MLADWLTQAASDHPRQAALLTSRGDFTYADIHARVAGLATRFQEAGLRDGKVTAVLSRDPVHIAWGLYLALYRGFPLLPLDPHRPMHLTLLDQFRVGQMLGDASAMDLFADRCECFPCEWLLDEVAEDSLPPGRTSADAIQLLVATSGTDGIAKAAMLSGANLATSVRASRERIGLDAGDVWLACLPLQHIGGLSILLRCLEAGATTLLHAGFDPARIWNDLDARAVTHISLVPAMVARLLDHASDAAPPKTLKTVLVGGGPLNATLARRARRAGWPLCVSYGLSEAASQVATLCAPRDGWATGDVGEPLDGVHVEIVDQSGRATDGVGRIRISGPTVMTGYANPTAEPGMGLDDGGFTSTDLGYIDEHSHLYVLGRADDVIVSGGENIHPGEVEARLADCPGIGEVAVTSRPDPVWGECLVAVYTGPADPLSLGRWCRDYLVSHLRPREFVRVKRLPANESGKLDRRLVRESATGKAESKPGGRILDQV